MRSYRAAVNKDSFLSIIIFGFIKRHRIAFAFFFAAGSLFSASLFGQYAKINDSSLRHEPGVSKNFAYYKSNYKSANQMQIFTVDGNPNIFVVSNESELH